MKVLALLFVIGCVSASFYDALDQASDDVVSDFLLGMEFAPSLQEVAGGLEYSNYEELNELEDDLKTELGKTLRESLDEVLRRIRERVEKGKEVSRELVEKAKEISEKLKEVGQEAGSKAKELLEKIKEKAKDWLKDLLSKIGLNKRSLVSDLLENLNVRSLLQKLVEKISNKLNLEQIREYVKKIFGEFSEIGRRILETLRSRGKAALKDLISAALPRAEQLEEGHYELVPIENAVAPHVQKRWVVIAKAACMLVKYIGLGWGKNKLQSWIDANVEPNWRGKLSAALKVSVPALKFLLGRFCYAAAPAGPVDYSVVELWEKIKEFFRGLGLQVQERFFNFAMWVREAVQKGVITMKSKLENVKQIAKQVVEQAKTLSKETAREALEFLQPYKEDLGTLFDDAKDAIKRILGREF